jgi:hypothetical protein
MQALLADGFYTIDSLKALQKMPQYIPKNLPPAQALLLLTAGVLVPGAQACAHCSLGSLQVTYYQYCQGRSTAEQTNAHGPS